MLGDEAWSIRVKLAGEKLANAREDLRRPYERHDTPRYIRLRDGRTVPTVEDAIALGLEDARVLTGKVIVYKKEWALEGLPNKMGRTRKTTLENLTETDEAWLESREGERVRLVQIKGEDGYQLVHVEPVTPSPEQLRAWCAEHRVTAFPDARPVEHVEDGQKRMSTASQGSHFKKVNIYTYTWPRQELVIPPAAR